MSGAPSLPPGARVLPLHEQPTGVAAGGHSGTKDTFSRASPSLTALRVTRLLPETTALAKRRVQALRRLYATPLAELKEQHEEVMASTVTRLRLSKSVRNVRVAGGGSRAAGVVGALCMPFTTCGALPRRGPSDESALVATGAVDGMLTVWDVHSCAALASASSCVGNQWGRVRAIAAAAPSSSGLDGIFFTATMFDRRIGVWRASEADADAAAARGGLSSSSRTESSVGQSPAPPWTLSRLDSIDAVASAGPVAHHHIASINQLAADPTGSLLASTSDDATLRLWDVHTLQQTLARASTAAAPVDLPHALTQDGYGSAGALYGVAFHPDGSLVSSTDAGGRVVTWDVRSGRHAFTTIVPAPQGPSATARQRHGGHLSRCTCVAWSPCGVRLVSGGADSVVQLWDARALHRAYTHTGTARAATDEPFSARVLPWQIVGHTDVVTSVGFYGSSAHAPSSPRGLLAAALISTSLDGSVKLWDADTGLCAHTLHVDSPIYQHCQPAASRGSGGHTEVSPAIFTVGHSKYWALWDVSDGRAEENAGAAVVTETDTVVAAGSGLQSAIAAAATTVRAPKGGPGKGSKGDDDDDEAGEEEDDDDEEDEMEALLKNRKKTVVEVAAGGDEAGSSSESCNDEEDEMEMLRKKSRR